MGANWIRGKSSLLPTNRIIGFSAQSQHSCWRGLACALSPPRQGEPAGTAQTRRFSISAHAGIGAATGASWCGPASDRHSTGTCWEALVGSDGCSPSCPRDVALSPRGDSRGGHQAPLTPPALQSGARHHRDPAGHAHPVPAAAGGIKASIHSRAGPASVISCSPGAASVTPARC